MNTTDAPQGVRTFSVRVPETLYGEARRIADNKKVSVNALVSAALSRIVEEEHDREMYDAATRLGSGAETTDVGFAFSAQSEVVLGHE